MTILAIVLAYFFAMPFSNCIYPGDKQSEPCESDATALDSFEESTSVRNLQQQLVNCTLDESTVSAFPVLRDEHIEFIDIAEEIGNSKSERFGMKLLGTGKEKLEIVDRILQNPDTANVRIFSQWFNGKGVKPITCKTLVNALDKIGSNKLASEIETSCDIAKIMDKHYKPELVKEYSQLLSVNYELDKVIDSTLWLPKKLHRRNIMFVDLELKEEGSSILLADLLDDLQSGTRILFLGRPGVGKTTIIRHLSKKLVHMERFYLVVKVHLGLAGEIDSLNSLLQASLLQAKAIESFDSDEISLISNYLSKALGEGVCFVLDGFDEYSGSGYVANLVQGTRLAKSTLIVTSRPSAAEDIKHSFNRIIEIFGFGEQGITTYLKQLELTETKYQTIYNYLHAHPNVRQLCYLPLHLSMLVYISVVTAHNDALSLADTETTLYSDFLSLTIKQYESRHEQTVETLKECFNDVYRTDFLCSLLWNISKNAFEGIMSRDQTFNSSSFGELPGNVNITAEIENLSLFRIEKIYGRRGNKLYKYYYSHPTFQEFFAGLHLTTLHREEQLNFIHHYWMHEVYKFFLGLVGSELKKKDDDEPVSQTFVRYAIEDLATYQNQELHIMKCAHEIGQSSQFITMLQAVGVVTNGNSVQVHADYNHDCWYIGYTLTQSQTPWHEVTVDKHSDLAICISSITNYLNHDPKVLESVNVTKLALGKDYAGYWPWFTEKEDPTSTVEVLNFLPAFQKDLTHLNLAFLKFEYGSSVLRLGETLNYFKKLEFLALSVNISIIKEGHLESALRNLAFLQHLELAVINKYDDYTVIPDDLFEFEGLQQLHNFTLSISWNKEVDVNMSALIGGLQYLTELQTLCLRIILYGGFRDNGATELLQGLEKVSKSDLELHLDLCWEYGMGNVTAEEVASLLRGVATLKKLSLCINFFSGVHGHSSLIELTEGLKGLTEVQELSLELRWEIQANEDLDEASTALADGLKHLHSLNTLELNLQQNGSFSGIASLFKSLAQLQELILSWHSPRKTKSDLIKLISGLKYLKQLRKLNLSHNNVDMGDDSMVPLITALKHMNSLITLDLSHNNIGDTGIQLLAELIESGHLSHLQVLLLNQNNFSVTGAKILSLKVVKLSELHILDFGIALGAYSAQALIQIQERRNTVFSSIRFSDEFCDFILVDDTGILGFSVGISVLVCGLLCYLAFKLVPVGHSAMSNKILPLSENLALSTFSASSAWNLEILKNRGLNGTGTVIAILDTTIDLTHPAFQQQNIRIIDKLPGLPVTSIEHGSICASVAVGASYQTSPTTTVPSGVAPGAQLIMYRVAEGMHCYDEAILAALDDMREKIVSGTQIDVVSISYNLEEDNAREIHRKIKLLTEKGVAFVAAAGNRGRFQPHASIPANFEDCVISAGSLDKYGYASRFTACGRVDVSAPGENIPTPLSSGTYEGTSFAAPAIGGLVLLLKQCANLAGAPARDNIHHVRVLKSIFSKDMITVSDSGDEIFYPVGFFQDVLDNRNLLNKIVMEHLDSPMDQ